MIKQYFFHQKAFDIFYRNNNSRFCGQLKSLSRETVSRETVLTVIYRRIDAGVFLKLMILRYPLEDIND